MSADRHTLLVSSLVIGGLLVIVLVWFAPRLLWIPAALAAVLAVTALLRLKNAQSVSPAMAPFDVFDVRPGERRATKFNDVLLPSGREDYSFLFSATVLWSPLGPALEHDDLSALAIEDVLRRARMITATRDPAHASFVRHELGGSLGRMRQDPTETVQAMAESIRLTLPERDRERLDRLATLRKEKAVWEHERKHEQSKREYLSKDVLKDPGSAVVWWLARNNDQVEKTVQDLRLLIQLAAAANNTQIAEDFQQYVPDLVIGQPGSPEGLASLAEYLDALLDFGEDEQSRSLFAEQLTKIATDHDQHALLSELDRWFKPPEPPADPPEPQEED